MRFIYILNKEKEIIDLCKIDSDRYEILVKLISFKIQEDLLPIEFNISKIEKLIDVLLIERNLKALEIPDYKGRFLENEIFKKKIFKGEELNLCNTGFDNKIIFLINIYENLLKNKEFCFLLFTNNHREFNDWQKNKAFVENYSKLKEAKKNIAYNFFDGAKLFNNISSYNDWLSSTDYSVWSNSYVEVGDKRIYIIKENVKVLSTFRYFDKTELELLAKKYNLRVKEENGIYYAFAPNHNSRQLEISENNDLIVIYSIDGGRAPERIFIYEVYEKWKV